MSYGENLFVIAPADLYDSTYEEEKSVVNPGDTQKLLWVVTLCVAPG